MLANQVKIHAVTTFGLISALSVSDAAWTQTLADMFPEQAKAVASDGAASDYFGRSVALDGDRVVVGVQYNDTAGGSDAGSVYVFDRSSAGVWVQTGPIVASDGLASDYFGVSVALDGDRMVVGAFSDNTAGGAGAGSVYVFDRSSAGVWVQTGPIVASDGAASDAFGYSVALDGDRMVVGAPDDDPAGGVSTGSVYVFDRSSAGVWVQTGPIVASDGAAADYFGSSVALDGDRMVVGADGNDTAGGVSAGSVYVFDRSSAGSWVQTGPIVASDGLGGDYFGEHIALDGDRMVVGAINDGFSRGSVYVFDRSSAGVWVQTGPIVASDGMIADTFGVSVALDGDRMVVGADYHDTATGGANAGSVYLFDRSSAGVWLQTGPIVASDGAASDAFGRSVALDGDRMVVGAISDDTTTGVVNAGSVYVMGCASVRNLTTTTYTSSNLAAEISRAGVGSTLALRASALEWAPSILDASNKRLTFVGVEPLTIPSSVMMTVATGTVFADGPELANGGLTVQGKLVGPSTGTVAFQQLTTASGGQVSQNGAYFLVNEALATSSGGVCYLDGQVLADSVSTAVGGQNRVAADTDVFGNYTNAGATIIQRGILYIYGTLTNTGTLTGDYNNGLVPPQSGDGYAIGGDYIVGAGASLVLPNPVWWLRVGGNVDIAINDPARFVMGQATLEMTGLSTTTSQSLEVMSANLGASETGFAANNFPIGAIRLRAGSITTLVNARDNAPGAGSEVMYVDTLAVPVGATLITGGRTIYVHSKSIQGTVSNPNDIVVVEACIGDIDGDGQANAIDLSVILTNWGGNGQGFYDSDLNDDGIVDGLDLGTLMGAWGACSN